MTRGTATTLNRNGTCHLIRRRRKRKRKESAVKPSNRFSPARGSSGRRRVSANSERGGKAKRSTGSYRSLLLSGGPYVNLLSFSLSVWVFTCICPRHFLFSFNTRRHTATDRRTDSDADPGRTHFPVAECVCVNCEARRKLINHSPYFFTTSSLFFKHWKHNLKKKRRILFITANSRQCKQVKFYSLKINKI